MTDFNAVYDQYTRRRGSILILDVASASDFARGVKGIAVYLLDRADAYDFEKTPVSVVLADQFGVREFLEYRNARLLALDVLTGTDSLTSLLRSATLSDLLRLLDVVRGSKGISYYLGDVLQVIDRSEIKRYQLYLTDYLNTLESFFRVSRRILFTDLYQIFDYTAFSSKSSRITDYLNTLDYITTRKSLSSLALSLLLQRKIPVRYVTLALTDYISGLDSIRRGKADLYIADVISLLDSLSHRAGSITVNDYSNIYDWVKIPTGFSITDLLNVIDLVEFSNRGIRAVDYLTSADLVTLQKSLSPSFLSLLLQRRVPLRYITLALTDYISTLDSTTLQKSLSPLALLLLLQRKVPIRYVTLALTDYISFLDEIRYGKADIRASDYLTGVDGILYSGKGIMVEDITQTYELTDYRDIGVKSGEYLYVADSVALSQKVEVGDYVLGLDEILYSGKGIGITDYLSLLDLSALVKSISLSFLSLLLQRRVPIRYLTLTLTDYVSGVDGIRRGRADLYITDAVSLFDLLSYRAGSIVIGDYGDIYDWVKMSTRFDIADLLNSADLSAFSNKGIRVIDYSEFRDLITLYKSLSPLILSLLLQRRVPLRYITLALADYLLTFDTVIHGKADVRITDYLTLVDEVSYSGKGVKIEDTAEIYELAGYRDIGIKSDEYLHAVDRIALSQKIQVDDYILGLEEVSYSGRGVRVVDYLTGVDSVSYGSRGVKIAEYSSLLDRIVYRKANINVIDYLSTLDSTISPRFLPLLEILPLIQEKTQIRYRRRVLTDYVYITDQVLYIKTGMYFNFTDYAAVYDLSRYISKTVSVFDYMSTYDHIPSTNIILYNLWPTTMYLVANIRDLLQTLDHSRYERKSYTVAVFDTIAVSDGVSVLRRSSASRELINTYEGVTYGRR